MGYLHLCITCVRHLESSAPNFPIRLNKYATGDSLFLWVSCSIYRVSTQRDIWALCRHFQVCAPGSLKINIFLQATDLHKYLFSYLPSSGTFEQYSIYVRYCNCIIQLYFFFTHLFHSFSFLLFASFLAEEKFIFIKVSIFYVMFDYGKENMLIFASNIL